MAVNEDFEGQSPSIDALNDVSEAEWQIAQAETVAPPEAVDPSAPLASNEEDSAPNTDADGQSVPANSIEFAVDGNNTVRLPANADLGELRLNGSNLEFVQPDGSIFVILQGAVQGLSIFLGDVQLPAEAVAALFQANNIQPAAGPDVGGDQAPAEQPLPEGRGAYQDSSQGSIGDGIGITTLLPPTELAFGEPEQEELFEGIPEEDNGDPAFPALDAGTGAFVDEEALSYGSNPTSDQEETSGNLAISTGPNSVSSLFIDGVDVTNGGTVTTGTYGTLVVTGSPSTGYSWIYTLRANTEDHPDDTSTGTSEGIFDGFNIVLTDSSGASVGDTLQVDVRDDGPLATADTDRVTEDAAGVDAVADGNVITASGGSDSNSSDGVLDTAGADGIASIAWTDVSGTTVAGDYGTLTVGSDGSYSYALNNALAAVQGLAAGETLTDVFSYTITDGDGDTSTADLTITIDGADDGVTISGIGAQGGDETVDEDDLSDGSSTNIPNLIQTGTFSISAPDGYDDLTIGGTLVVTNGTLTLPGTAIATSYGELTITAVDLVTGTVSYSYELTDNTFDHGPGDNSENTIQESIPVVLTDTDGSTDNSNLIINVIDDVPTATADTGAVNEGALLTVLAVDGVLSNDEGGADGLASIEGVRAAGADLTTDVSGGVTGSIAGEHGTLVLAADGSYTYQSNADAITGNQTDVFVYTIIDGDGDLATTTLTINLTDGTDPIVSAPITLELDDEHLADGSDPTADDFVQDSLTFTEGSNPFSSIVFDTDLNNLGGSLTWTRVSDIQILGKDGGGVTIVTLDLLVSSNVATVTATLNDNYATHPTVDVDDLEDLGSVGVVATDTGAMSVTGTVNVDVSDDLPSTFAANVVYADDVTGFTTVGDINFAGQAGADGVGTIGFNFTEGAPALDSDGNQLKLNGAPIFLYEGADSTILVGATGANATTGVAFTIDLDPVAGTYSFTINEGAIANSDTSSFTNLSGVGGGNNNLYALGTATAGGNDIILSGSDTINTNANNIGIAGQQAISTGEILRYDFLTDVSSVDPSVIAGPYYTLTKFAQEFDSVSGGTADFSIKLIDTDGDSDFYGDAGDTFMTLASFTVKLYNGNPATTGVLQSTFTSSSGVATVTGGLQGWFYEIESNTPFEAFQYEGMSNTRVKLGEISIETAISIDPFTMDVALIGTDGDGDTTTGSLEVNFLPPAPTIIGTEGDDNPVTGTSGDDYLLGLGGTDFLTGLAGDDVLIGGSGSDTMTGGGDADTFIIGADSLQFSIKDVITDYSESQGDEIDLSEILGGLGLTDAGNDLDADGFVTVTATANPDEYTIAVDKDGTAGTTFSAVDVATVTVADGTSISILFDDSESSQDVLL